MAKKILLIEDDTMLQTTLVKHLTQDGYEVRSCTNADDAFALLDEEKPDLILTDLVIQGTDGFEILKMLHENFKFTDIPVIALSNLAEEKDIKRAKELGAHNYLIKAEHSLEDIVEKVQEILK